jgi:hypothetical protein
MTIAFLVSLLVILALILITAQGLRNAPTLVAFVLTLIAFFLLLYSALR